MNCKIKCIYPTGLEITKNDIDSLKNFKQIILNYLKIERLNKISKFKIETVSNHICKLDNFIVSYYMPAQDRIVNTSFCYEELARTRNGLESGMWRIKSLKNKNNQNLKQNDT